MSHYKTNLRDIEFNLFEVLNTQEYMGEAPFEDMDQETAEHMLSEIDRFAVEEYSASFVDADRNPPKLENGEVVLPQSLKDVIRAYEDAGWDSLFRPPEHGGVAAPMSLRWAGQELLVGANPTAFLFNGTLMPVVLNEIGTPEQIERFVVPALEHNWGGTMVLTEPDAGSDVGAGVTKAIPVDEDAGIYHLEGVKRFITSGEHDAAENIVHLVLARPIGAGPGTKGLSMFVVPKYMVNDDGSLGERNGVFATNLEKKMGIKASTTCELSFGVDKPCVGYLVGNVHDGIRQMFQVIERARMLIGTKSTATLSTAYLNSLEYAKERVQGPDMTRMTDKTAPRVEIIRHPDVRRMLMLQKSYAEGLRALLYYTGWVQDQKLRSSRRRSHGRSSTTSSSRWSRVTRPRRPTSCLRPRCRYSAAPGSPRTTRSSSTSATPRSTPSTRARPAIQALDLFFRKIARDQGQTLTGLAGQVLEMVKGGPEELAAERELLGKALDNTQGHLGVMVGHLMGAQQDPSGLYKLGLHANSLLESVAEVTIAWLLLRHAEAALAALPGASERDKLFYEGKLASARFFVGDALPKTLLRREAAEREDGWLMDLPDEAF